MPLEKTHVYFVPGMAAGAEIFRNINFPKDVYEVHILEWFLPLKEESLTAYAKRMAAKVEHPNSVLVGISFGGIVAQEMSVFLDLKKLIIVSSVKSKKEFPKRIKLARKTLFYKLIPTKLILSSKDLTRFAVGAKSVRRLKMYQQFLNFRDKNYLDWALKNLICWNRKEVIKGLIHIHGDKDLIFPIKQIENCKIIKGGTHVMILNKGSAVSDTILDFIKSK